MAKRLAKENERLDTIVYETYGDLEVFPLVLEKNSKLPAVFDGGEVVELPDIQPNIDKTEKTLW